MCTMLKKIASIYKGWWLWAMDNKKSRDLMETRMPMCKLCPNRIRVTNTCKECGCFLPAKTRVPDESCPIDLW